MIDREVETACDRACRRRRRRHETLRGRAPLAAFGIAAFPMLISVAIGGRPAVPAASDQVRTVVLLSVQFLNSREDLEPTTGAERARLASLGEVFKSKLEGSGWYRFLPIPDEEAAEIASGPEIGNCGWCEFDYGKQLGGDIAAWIVVQKVSDLILNINVCAVDVAAKKLRFAHSVDVRGDTDESWTRGMI